MSPVASHPVSGAKDTRERLIEAAVRLFACHSFAGTSLQMIADELRITKAAVYHHFRTREELLAAVVRPALAQLRVVVEEAEVQRTPHARADHMLTGYAGLAVRHRSLVGMLGTDAAVGEMLQAQEGFAELIRRHVGLLADAHPGPAGRVNAVLAVTGIASAATSPLLADLDDESLRRHLVEAGRRALGLRAPRHPAGPGAAPAQQPHHAYAHGGHSQQ